MTANLPSLAEAKAAAKRLRAAPDGNTPPLSHSQSLELIAQQHGYRNWSSFHAVICHRPHRSYQEGERVRGTYLSRPFAATILKADIVKPGWTRLSLQFDEAVDVVSFQSFSNLRTRIRSTVGPAGHSAERTSDGQPHLKIEM